MFSFTGLLQKSVALALPIALLATSQSSAGLIRQIRTSEALGYSQFEIRDLDDRELKKHWNDQIDYVNLKSPLGAAVYSRSLAGEDGKPIVITMLVAMPACGIRECPIRVYSTEGALLLDTMGCAEASEHFISVDRREFSACGVHHDITSSSKRPGTAESTKSMWHNGSLMEVSFYVAGEVQIRYLRPKVGLPPSLRGQLLFDGHIERARFLLGTAYTFKSGCAPTPYLVRGSIDRQAQIALVGEAPMRDRRSCAVLGFTAQSPNAWLSFSEATEEANH
jgi:hypothetical protein